MRVCAAGATLTPNFMSVTDERSRGLTYPSTPEAVVETALRSLTRRGGSAVVVPGRLNRAVEFVLRRLFSPSQAVRIMRHNMIQIYQEQAVELEPDNQVRGRAKRSSRTVSWRKSSKGSRGKAD